MNELGVESKKLISVRNYDGLPILASLISEEICAKAHKPTQIKGNAKNA
jgi:hypothetical protein